MYGGVPSAFNKRVFSSIGDSGNISDFQSGVNSEVVSDSQSSMSEGNTGNVSNFQNSVNSNDVSSSQISDGNNKGSTGNTSNFQDNVNNKIQLDSQNNMNNNIMGGNSETISTFDNPQIPQNTTSFTSFNTRRLVDPFSSPIDVIRDQKQISVFKYVEQFNVYMRFRYSFKRIFDYVDMNSYCSNIFYVAQRTSYSIFGIYRFYDYKVYLNKLSKYLINLVKSINFD